MRPGLSVHWDGKIILLDHDGKVMVIDEVRDEEAAPLTRPEKVELVAKLEFLLLELEP